MSDDNETTPGGLQILRRSLGTARTDGRTIVGVAVPFNVAALVKDPGIPAYWEAHAPSSFDRSMNARVRSAEPFPAFIQHDWLIRGEPIGVATFRRSDAEQALVYELGVSKTRKGDEALELVRDGALLGNSVGFRPRQSKRVRVDGRTVVMRTENELRELSLAPTGMEQHPGARVMAIRSIGPDATFDEVAAAVLDAITRKFFGDKGPDEDTWVYIKDITSEWAVYQVTSSTLPESKCGLFQVQYNAPLDGDDDDVVLTDDPKPVEVTYSYVEQDGTAGRTAAELAADEKVRAAAGEVEEPPEVVEAAKVPLSTGSSTPRLDAARRRNALLGREGVAEPKTHVRTAAPDELCPTCGERDSRHVGDLKLCPTV